MDKLECHAKPVSQNLTVLSKKPVILLFHEDAVISVQIFLNAREGGKKKKGLFNFWISQGRHVLCDSELQF